MGPTSQGPTTSSNLAVEHYLGSCLISATARKHPGAKHQDYQHPQQQQHHHQHHPHAQPPPPYNGWTGMPLISMAAAGRRTNKESVQVARSPLSRLAIHTQGAPLILAGHYGRGGNKGPQHMGHKGPQVPLRLIVPKHHPAGPILTPLASMRKEPPKTPGSPPVSDNVSVASDESSGHSENSLPRIIKPRKRRKKERKPSNSSSSPETESPPGGQPTSIVTLQPYVPLCYEFDKFKQRAARKPADKVAPLEVRPDLLHPLLLDEELQHPALCQCSLCDPAGLIFDVERLCHSPTLLSPPLYRVSSTPPIGWRRDELFRTTSEPVVTKPTEYCVQHELEVTSEIVTSLNGHRDIEIRFFVPSSSGWKPSASEE